MYLRYFCFKIACNRVEFRVRNMQDSIKINFFLFISSIVQSFCLIDRKARLQRAEIFELFFHQQSYISIFVSLTAAAWVKHQEKMIKGILFSIKTKTEFWSSSFLKLCLPSLLLDCIFNMPTVSKAFLLCSY